MGLRPCSILSLSVAGTPPPSNSLVCALQATGAQDAAKVQEEERRESAAVAIQQAWRARAAHRAQLAALARLRAAARHHGHFQRRFKCAA